MTRDQLIKMLGGSKAAAARAMGCTRQTIHNLPETGQIPREWEDRAKGAAIRLGVLKVA